MLAFLAGTPAPLAAARASVPVADLIELAERYRAAGRAALTSDQAANWHQVEIEFPDRYTAERTVATRIAPRPHQAEESGVVTSWWYIRKTPHWRLRLRPDESHRQLRTFVTQMLDELMSKRFVVAWLVCHEPDRGRGRAGAMSAYPNRNAGAGPARPATGDLDGVVGIVSPTGTRPGSDEAVDSDRPADDAKLAALLGAADTVLAVHVPGVHGLCVACLEGWGRLTPHPCSHAEWASAALARYSAPQPNSGARDEV